MSPRSKRRAGQRKLLELSLARVLGGLVAVLSFFAIVATLFGQIEPIWAVALFILTLVLGILLAQRAGGNEFAVALRQSDLEVVPAPQSLPVPVSTAYQVAEFDPQVPALRSGDGRLMVIRGRGREVVVDADGDRGHADHVVAYAVGLPPAWRTEMTVRRLWLPQRGRKTSTDALGTLLARAFRDTRVRGGASIRDGCLVCYASHASGRKTVRFVKAAELALYRLHARGQGGTTWR